MIRVRGRDSWYWLGWWTVLFAWTLIAFFFVPHRVWIFVGGPGLFGGGWFFQEIIGALENERRKRLHLPEVILTSSQVPQLISQLAHANTRWYVWGKGLAILMLVVETRMAGAWFWEIDPVLGVAAYMLVPLSLWHHYWNRSYAG